MKTSATAIACTCLIIVMAYTTRSKEWRGIVPLQSTRMDVERLLGPPDKPGRTLYISDNVNVMVWYSNGVCKGDAPGWNVPRDVVTELTVFFKVKPFFNDLKIDESKYKKERDPHLLGLVYYNNDEEGISFAVDTNLGVVNSATYFPAAKDNKLRCPNSALKDCTKSKH